MSLINRTLAGFALVALGLPACYSAELDPTLGGVFACSQAADDCPSGLTCVNGACEKEDQLPVVVVTNPEDEELFVTNAPDVPMGPMAPPFELEVRIQGELELVAANSGAEHVFGQGHVVVYIDEVEQAVIDSGDISTPTAVTVEVDNQAGPHRITALAMRNDGEPYDNADATGGRLIWVESELIEGVRPFVAIKSPWPGSTVPLETTSVDVEIATLNFTMVAPGQGEVEEQGHAHIYYDKAFPDCLADDDCDKDYIAVAGDPPTVTASLPESSAQSIDLTAVLRQVGHDQYRFPFGCDPIIDGGLCQPVFDTIEINRADR